MFFISLFLDLYIEVSDKTVLEGSSPSTLAKQPIERLAVFLYKKEDRLLSAFFLTYIETICFSSNNISIVEYTDSSGAVTSGLSFTMQSINSHISL